MQNIWGHENLQEGWGPGEGSRRKSHSGEMCPGSRLGEEEELQHELWNSGRAQEWAWAHAKALRQNIHLFICSTIKKREGEREKKTKGKRRKKEKKRNKRKRKELSRDLTRSGTMLRICIKTNWLRLGGNRMSLIFIVGDGCKIQIWENVLGHMAQNFINQ